MTDSTGLIDESTKNLTTGILKKLNEEQAHCLPTGYKHIAAAHIARRCPGLCRLLRKRLIPMPCFHTQSQLFPQVPQS